MQHRKQSQSTYHITCVVFVKETCNYSNCRCLRSSETWQYLMVALTPLTLNEPMPRTEGSNVFNICVEGILMYVSEARTLTRNFEDLTGFEISFLNFNLGTITFAIQDATEPLSYLSLNLYFQTEVC